VELRDNLFGTVSGSFHVIRVPGGASRHPDSHNTWNNLRGAPHQDLIGAGSNPRSGQIRLSPPTHPQETSLFRRAAPHERVLIGARFLKKQ
jgi:hypothetical protein